MAVIAWMCFLAALSNHFTHGQVLLNIKNNEASLTIEQTNTAVTLLLKHGTETKLNGEIGVKLKEKLTKCQDGDNCFQAGQVRLSIMTDIPNGFSLYWSGEKQDETLQDCFSLTGSHWYGGPETKVQKWPIEKLVLNNLANVLKEQGNVAVVEPYWLNSKGAYIFVNEKVPLFVDQNTDSSKDKVCFSAKADDVFKDRKNIVLSYSIVAKDTPKDAHLHAVDHFLGKPTGHPNHKFIERPVWSTWAKYKRDVSDAVLLEFLQQIVDNGYPDGQFEIDDNWEDCYGSLTFSQKNFSDINETVKKIKQQNFRVTLWVHPFINDDCTKYRDIADKLKYLVYAQNGSSLTQWWNSKNQEAHHLDFTKAEVRSWYTERLRRIQIDHGIDSFKFDAGETSWLPQLPVVNGDVDTIPNSVVPDYVKTCAAFGDLVEVRSGWKTQNLPIFIRMIDKDSNWGDNNGLYTLITTLLQMNINGYTLVLPDMVGGNGYDDTPPTDELFARWIQANAFMPAIQFSYVPWEFNNSRIDVKGISKAMVDLHQAYTPYIEKQMNRSIIEGHPVNAPVWWLAPTDPKAQAIDTQFLLGDDVVVAPVVEQGAVSREVYLPPGDWYDPNTDKEVKGDTVIANYSAPINVLPYFVRVGSEADLRTKSSSVLNTPQNLLIFLALLIGYKIFY